MDEPKTPSMDDKQTPSPPLHSLDQYEANKAAGVIPWHEPPVYGEKREKSAKQQRDDSIHGDGLYVPGQSLREVAIGAARARVDRYREAWEAAKVDRDRAVADCVKDHAHLPDNYWQAEHRARALYGSALQLLDALEPFVHNEG